MTLEVGLQDAEIQDNRSNALCLAAARGSTAGVETLLAARANPNASKRYRSRATAHEDGGSAGVQTVLMMACGDGSRRPFHGAVVNLLVDAKADIEILRAQAHPLELRRFDEHIQLRVLRAQSICATPCQTPVLMM